MRSRKERAHRCPSTSVNRPRGPGVDSLIVADSKKCGACGASAVEAGGDFCSFCGAELPKEPVVVLNVDVDGDRQRRFDAVTRVIEERAREAAARSDSCARESSGRLGPVVRASRGEAVLVGLFVTAALAAIWFFFGPELGLNAQGESFSDRVMAAISGSLPLLAVLVILTPIAVLWGLSASSERMRRRVESRAGRLDGSSMVALRIAERVTDGVGDGVIHTLIVESADALRMSYRIEPSHIGDSAAGDFGVGYVKGARLLRFDRVT